MKHFRKNIHSQIELQWEHPIAYMHLMPSFLSATGKSALTVSVVFSCLIWDVARTFQRGGGGGGSH